MGKKLFAVILSSILCGLLGTTGFALTVQPVGMSPMYVNTTSISASLTFSGDTATLKGTVQGKTGVTQISANTQLQRKSGTTWETIESWSNTLYSDQLSISKTATVSKGYTYRVKLDAKVTAGSVTESITQYSKEVSH